MTLSVIGHYPGCQRYSEFNEKMIKRHQKTLGARLGSCRSTNTELDFLTGGQVSLNENAGIEIVQCIYHRISYIHKYFCMIIYLFMNDINI